MTPVRSEQDRDLAERAVEVYRTRLKALLEPCHNGSQVAIHVPDEDFEVAPTAAEAVTRLKKRHPNSVFVLLEVGRPLMEWPWINENAPVGKP